MKVTTKMGLLLGSMLAMVFTPWLGAWFYFKRGHFPDGFFDYPPLQPMPKPGFNLLIFTGVALGCLVMSAIYLFPGLFGFKKTNLVAEVKKPAVRFPYWFWFGTLAWSSVMMLFIFKDENPVWFIHWSDLPLFWGFTLMLDGWVYVRNGGVSLMSKVPQELIGIGVASVSGWMIFEFLNFFIDDNWYYPKGSIIDREEFLLYACIISSGLLPLSFEWYCVFKTYPKLSTRFSNGIKIRTSKLIENIILVVAYASMFAAGLFPNMLFFALWTSPPIILAIILNRIGVWTPLKDIRNGNWSPALLSALTYFITGLCLEGQNYLSAKHHPVLWTEDPAYWQYSLPYVDVLHVFEMPLLGLFGYLPFGVYCWLWWIACATLLNIPARFLSEHPLRFESEIE